MKILFASSEVMPFSKTGGLADVSCALPEALARRGHEVLIVTPRYGAVDITACDLKRKRFRIGIGVKGKISQGGLLEGKTPGGVPVLFVDQAGYFEREGLYGTADRDFPDNDERFAFFSRAVLESCRLLGFSPDVIHCNDWQTGPVPALLQNEYRDRPELNSTGTVFTIHNIGYQGLFPPEAIMTLGFNWSLFTPTTLEFFGKVSFLKSGLVFADKLTTVSVKHAEEIKTAAYGFGLDGLLRERAADLKGIINGVDYSVWDPRTDRNIVAKYSPEDLSGKEICKADLQKRMGLPVDPSKPLIGCISRLTFQKGIDLLLEVSGHLLALNCQWIFLGTGDHSMEDALRELAGRHPQRIAVHMGYSEELAHQIQAGSDIFLMPSRYEPCGLNQIYAQRYGTIPVVRSVGGLDDTVEDVSEGLGTGFKFKHPTGKEMNTAVRKALELYADKPEWRKLIENAMAQDFSWDLPSRRYEKLYQEVISLRAVK